MTNMSLFQVSGILVLFLLLVSCKSKNQQSQQNETQTTTVEFKQPIFDFGNIIAGERVSHTFYFKNTGKHNLVINNIETSCGCTTVDFNKEPIKAGAEGKVAIEFNSSGRYGKQYKEISIFANVPEKTVTLKIIANVKETENTRS